MNFSDNRKTKRVSDAMALRIEQSGDAIGHAPLNTTPTHVVNISTGGMRFLNKMKLACSEPLVITMKLGPQMETASLHAEVISSPEVVNHSGNKRYNTHVKFINVDKTAQTLLDLHIDHVLEQTSKHCRQFQYKVSA